MGLIFSGIATGCTIIVDLDCMNASNGQVDEQYTEHRQKKELKNRYDPLASRILTPNLVAHSYRCLHLSSTFKHRPKGKLTVAWSIVQGYLRCTYAT